MPDVLLGENKHKSAVQARSLQEHVNSQQASLDHNGSFAYTQTALLWVLGLLDQDLGSPVNLQELTSSLVQASALRPGRANRLSRSLNKSQEYQASAGKYCPPQ